MGGGQKRVSRGIENSQKFENSEEFWIFLSKNIVVFLIAKVVSMTFFSFLPNNPYVKVGFEVPENNEEYRRFRLFESRIQI